MPRKFMNVHPLIRGGLQVINTFSRKLSYKIFVACMIVSLALAALPEYKAAAAATTYYSRTSADWAVSSTWSTTSCGGAAASAYPIAGDTVIICSGNTVTVAADAAAGNITFNAPAANGGITINGTYTLTVSGEVIMNSATAASTTTLAIGTGVLNAGSLTISGANTATYINTVTVGAGTLNVTGNVSFNSGNQPASAVLNVTSTSAVVTIGGNLSGAAGNGSLTLVNPTSISLGGNYAFAGTLSNNNRLALTLNGTGSQTVNGTNTFCSLTVNKSSGTASLGAAPSTVAGALAGCSTFTLTAGTFDPGSFLLTAPTVIQNGGTLKVNTTTTAGNYSTVDTAPAAGSTIEYTNANPTINNTITYQNLVFSGTGTAGAGGNLTIQGNLTNTVGGTLNFGTGNVILSGMVMANNIAGFTTTGTVSMTKTAGTATFTGNVNGGALTINGTGGTLNLGTSLTHTFTGTWTRTAGTLNGGSSTLKIGTGSGTGGTFTAGTGTVEYTANNASVLTVTYNNLKISSAAATPAVLAGNTTISANLEIASGAKLNLNSKTSTSQTLTFAGVQQLSGTWGASGQSNNDSTRFTGFVLTVSQGPASQVVFTTQPSASTVAGVAFTQQPVVKIEDASGNVVTVGADSTVSVALTLTTGTGTLGGTTSMNAVAGVADFTGKGLNINLVGADKALTATATVTAGMKTTTTSPAFAITPAGIDHYVVSASSPETAGVTFSTTVTANDIHGNTVTTDSSTLVTMSSSGSTQFDSNGDGTFGDNTKTLSSGAFTIETKDNVAESMTITATSSSGGKTGTSTSITVYATGTWLGTISTDWFTAGNWWGGVPTSSTDVVIPSTALYQPIIDASGALCRNITINASASLTISNSYNLSVSGNWANGGSFTPATGTVVFNGGSAQTIGGAATTTFNNLTINNTSGVTASSDLTVNGVLTLQSVNPSATKGSLDMWDGSAMKTLTMGGSATMIGAGDVTGIVTRTSFVAATSYTFGNQYSTIDFQNTGTLPTSVSVKITIGAAPAWKPGAIQRTYDLIQSGASGSYATINVHYLDSELNGNTENELVWWVDNSTAAPGQVIEFGRSNYNLTNNWVGISSIPVSLFPSSFGQTFETLGNSALATATWNGSVSTEWINPLNWTPNGVPSDLASVVIPVAGGHYDPTLPVGALAVGTFTIQSRGIVNATATSVMTISGGSGAWSNNGGTFNPSTSTVIFTNAAATISGATEFYNVTINSGAGLTMGSNGTMVIDGTMTNNGTWHAAQNANNTVKYNGGNQAVLSPNGLTPGYDNLILSGSGTKTLASTTTVGGNVEIDSGVVFNLSNGGSSTVGSLTFGGVLQAAGTWGSSSSGATHQNDTYFQGTGMLNVSTGTADHITITSSTADLSSGSMRDITAEIRDANNNVVTSNNSTVVSFTQTAGAGSVSGTGDAMASSGIATKTVAVVTAGSVTITASATGLTSGTTTFTVTPGTASQVVFTTAPSTTGTSGTAWAQQPAVTVEDAAGNTVTSYATGVTLAINTGTGTLTCTTNPVTPSSGVATFAGCSLDKATTYTLQATSGTITDSTTHPSIAISAGSFSASQSTVTVASATDASGATDLVTLTPKDAAGNQLTDANATVIFSNSGGTSTGTFGGVTDTSGVYTATFTGAVAGTATTIHASYNSTAVTSTLPTITVTPVADLSITKTDSATSVNAGGTTTYTVRATNNGPSSVTGAILSDLAATGLSKTNVACSSTPGQCVTPPSVAQLEGGTFALPALASDQFYEITVSADVTATSGSVKNSASVTAPEDTTDPTPGNNTSTDTDTVVAPPSIAKTFGAATIPVGGTTALSFTITNPNTGTALTGVAFTDTLPPAGLKVATPNGLSGTCGGGTTTAIAGSGSITLSSATLPASGSCTFSVNVTGTTAGFKNNIVTVYSTNGGTGNTATGIITVVVPPSIAKTFNAATIPLGGTTTLSFTITNPNTGTVLTGVAFSDILPAGLTVVNGSSTPCGGTLTTTSTGTINLSGATIAAGGSCTFNVTVTGTTAGLKNNTTSYVTSTNGGTGNTASDSLTVVAPPSITKTFGAATILVGGTTTLSFTITNPNTGTALTGVAFTDTLPAGLKVAGTSITRCGGKLTTTAATGVISLSRGSIAAGGSCTFNVTVTGTTAWFQNNTTGNVTSTNGGIGNTATDSMWVQSSINSHK